MDVYLANEWTFMYSQISQINVNKTVYFTFIPYIFGSTRYGPPILRCGGPLFKYSKGPLKGGGG
jgi:hypothetical protein